MRLGSPDEQREAHERDAHGGERQTWYKVDVRWIAEQMGIDVEPDTELCATC